MLLLRTLLSRWVLSFLGVAALAVLAWIFGPLLPPFDELAPRIAVIVGLLAVWLLANLLLDWRRRRRDTALTQGVAVGDPAAAASAEEAAALRDKLSTALTLLRKARGSRGYLYELPWYAIIGPPGSGKTTALLNAGLEFPLAAELGQGAVAGVGGTRLCDWWFTDSAVLIDTAGRYTTQDSDAALDRAGWTAFLDLLKRTRPRQPLNGVLVAIAVPDVVAAPAQERQAHARAIRARIKELQERLGLRLPVYALFTKADLVAGFSEYFDDLTRETRAQVWGVTFPLQQPEAGPVPGFAPAFATLADRLDARLPDRLQAERAPDRRAMLAGFPAQVASLREPLADFLQAAFGGTRLDPAPMLRGVYLASGTQEGTPIDRLTGALSRAFGVDQRRAASLRPEAGRSYFLGRLLKDVVFHEAMLVAERPGAARQRLALRTAGFVGVALALLLGGGLVWRAQATARDQLATTAAAVDAYAAQAATLKLDPVAEADLPRVLPLLDQARALPHGVDRAAQDASGWGMLGLSQDAKLHAGGVLIYTHAVQRVLLPRLLWRLESQMRGHLNDPDFLYQATRVYLMLGSAGPLDRDLVRAWMGLDWQAAWPGAAQAPMRESLQRHLDTLLAQPLPAVALDGGLVEAARATFSRVPLAQRVYSRIRPSAAAQAVPPWRPADALGAGGVRVFTRASGKPLTEGISGFFTVDGFHRVLLPALGSVARDVAGESWVLGPRAEVEAGSPQMQSLERDVIARYEADYAAQWDAMLADLSVVPMRAVPQAAQDLYILSSPQSPMRDLLASVARQLSLSVPPAPSAAAGVVAAAANAAAGAATKAAGGAGAQLQGLLGAATGPAPKPPGQEIDDRYKPLRDFVGTGPGAPIDAALKVMNDLQQDLAKLAAAPAGGAVPAAPTGADPVTNLQAEATRDPQPVSRWLQAMAVSGSALRGGGARQQVAAAFNGSGGPASLCRQAVTGRYPFTPGAPAEIPLDDFGRLFAPGGLLDGFFNTQLRPYVDMSANPWRAQAVDGVPPPVAPGDLVQFQRAAVIRDLFFAAGGTAPAVRFDITPASLDSGATQVSLDLGGTVITYAQGPLRSTQIAWPGANRMDNVRLVFTPPPSTGTGVIQASGPWALFRLFDQGTLVQGATSETFTLTFKQGERQAVFTLRAGSVLNPFSPSILRNFRCPGLP